MINIKKIFKIKKKNENNGGRVSMYSDVYFVNKTIKAKDRKKLKRTKKSKNYLILLGNSFNLVKKNILAVLFSILIILFIVLLSTTNRFEFIKVSKLQIINEESLSKEQVEYIKTNIETNFFGKSIYTHLILKK
ncbi:MAG: hypothetical protein Q9M91_02590 [Candidatus Dojkabacteria bacterium]|nr:hypothetical protein [Candidatus Dojkabacteria bacterium]